jgi:hypothetical protein
LMENRNGMSQRYWMPKCSEDGYHISYGGLAMMSPYRNWQNPSTGCVQSTCFINDTSPNQVPYPNRTSRDFRLKEGLMSEIRIRWGVMEGACASGTMPRKAVQVI